MAKSFCCVPGCSDQSLARKIGVSRHRFPENEEMKKAWIRAVNNPEITQDVPVGTLKKFTVCGKHFKPSDYVADPKYTIAPHLYKGKPVMLLKKTSVPSLFLPEPEVPVLSEVSLEAPEPGTSLQVSRKRKIEESVSDSSQLVHTPFKTRRVVELQASPILKKKSLPSSTMTSEMIAQQQVTPKKTQEEPSTISPLSTSGGEFSSPGWHPSRSGNSSSESTDPENIESTKKAFVNLSCLDQLFKRCQICGDGIDTTSTSYKGAQIIIKWCCVQGHQDSWKSCPDIRKMPEINLLSSAATLFSGNSFSSISRFFEFLEVPFVSTSTYHRIQNTYLLPVIDQYYQECNLNLIGELILKGMEGIPISLLGDGRSDSPGFSAKYTTYSVMEESSEKIVDFQLVQVSEAGSSVAMEKIGFQRSLENLEGHGIPMSTITTDRSPSIIKFMRENYPDIVHQFDVWHVCKGIKKRLVSAGKKKGNDIILKWTKSITNHFWFACASCNGSYEDLKSIWLGVLNHIKDVHEWEVDGKFFKCGHGDLSELDREKKRWIDSTSQQYFAIEKIIRDKRLIKDMEKLTLFKHTGTLESYHNMMLKYIPKRIHYHFKAMQGRTQLAILDHNENVGRKQAVTKNKQPRYNIVGRKQDAGTFKARKVFEKKTYPYVSKLMQNTILRRQDESVQMSDPTHFVQVRPLPKNIYTRPVPAREDVIRQSERLSKKHQK